MDNPEEGFAIDSGQVPSALLDLLFRLQDLQQVVEVFKGWNPDVVASKVSALTALANSKKHIACIKSLTESLRNEYCLYEKETKRAKYLSLKCEFILNNIPDRFNCPSTIALQDEEESEVHSKAVAVESTKTSVKVRTFTPALEVPYLTVDEFEKVPKYLKGRVTYDKINTFVDVFNKVLSNKYAIFRRKKSTLKQREANLWNEFYKQELKETNGLYFCVGNDFKTFAGSALDKVSLNLLTILRHCGRIRELRTGGIVRYVAVF